QDLVFKDAKKGEAKPDESLRKAFHSTDINVIARRIIQDGEVQLTAVQRKEMVEKRRQEVVHFISRNAINPQTNSPHPPQRIETAMQEAKVHVDLARPFKEQVDLVVKEIR
ncbi:MAG: ribosome assembly factor SBDS, partial [Candidatus Diapherotrites archaeon]|nr:ribosome assembly factor SBDS [Candidatus Diapherotrites archaeon]